MEVVDSLDARRMELERNQARRLAEHYQQLAGDHAELPWETPTQTNANHTK